MKMKHISRLVSADPRALLLMLEYYQKQVSGEPKLKQVSNLASPEAMRAELKDAFLEWKSSQASHQCLERADKDDSKSNAQILFKTAHAELVEATKEKYKAVQDKISQRVLKVIEQIQGSKSDVLGLATMKEDEVAKALTDIDGLEKDGPSNSPSI